MRLKELRVNHNLKQKELGQITGISEAAISRLETGDRSPSIEVVISLANYFGVSIDYLLGTTDTPFPLSDKVMNIINQANNPEEIIAAIQELSQPKKTNQAGDQPGSNEINDLVKDLDEDSITELKKYVGYLKVRQTLDKGSNESSAGLDTAGNK